jgi:sigma-B regulation protein RsbU (phosphoserine phosphatase)
MKFRWKLLILLLLISIIPIVSLRTFGISNVRLMAEDLSAQVRGNRSIETRHQLQLLMNEYDRAVRAIRDQAEMALFFQVYEIRRMLEKDDLSLQHKKSSPNVDGSRNGKAERNGHPLTGMNRSDKNSAELASDEAKPCYLLLSSADSANSSARLINLKRLVPIFHAISQYLGNLVLRQYIVLENGAFSVYPCPNEMSQLFDFKKQIWYQSAFQEMPSAWSRPFVDRASGQTVISLSYLILTEDERVRGVASLMIPLERLLEQALQLSELPPGTLPFLVTLAKMDSSGVVGAKILASEVPSTLLPLTEKPSEMSRWLTSSDTAQFRYMLEDIARRQFQIREMPFGDQNHFWAYGPLMHQGSAFVFVVPKDQIFDLKRHPVLASIQQRLKMVENYTIGFLFFLILLASAAALAFSRTVTRPLEQLSNAAAKLSQGDFESRVSIVSNDEFASVGRIFNSIGPQLKENYRLQRSLEVAEEIQRNLLPKTSPIIPGLDIHGMTLFSHKTGGDYFDYLCVDEKQKKFCVVVGDVAGHGIPSALLMASARGFLKLRTMNPGTLDQIVTDINKEFIKDVDNSGRFMTLFLARIDLGLKRFDWVRAGHDPAILYHSRTDSFTNLDEGRGPALGITEETVYGSSSCDIRRGQILFLGTDGIWEACNADGELFGKKRLQQVIRDNSEESARTIALTILDAVEEFRGDSEQEDDLTLMIIKMIDL